MCLAQPEVAAPSSAPIDGADASSPTVPAPPWNQVTPIAGNNARGMPKTIALMSTRNVMSRFLRGPRKRSPSSTDAKPGRDAPPSGGMAGSRETP